MDFMTYEQRGATMKRESTQKAYRLNCADIRNALDDALMRGKSQIEFERYVEQRARFLGYSEKLVCAVVDYARQIDTVLIPF